MSAVIGVLAAVERPDLFDRLVRVRPSPRYIDDEGYRGGFSRTEIEELLHTMDGNYLGWAVQIAPVIIGVPERRDLSQELASSFCRTDPTIARHFARTTFLSNWALRHVRTGGRPRTAPTCTLRPPRARTPR